MYLAKIFKSLRHYALTLLIPSHLVFLFGSPFLFSNPQMLGWSALGWLVFGPIGLGIGYHRLVAHQSFRAHPLIERLLILLGALAGQGKCIEFALVHKAHHRTADTEKDVQSPIRGLYSSYFWWKISKNVQPSIVLTDYRHTIKRFPFLNSIDRLTPWLFWLVFSLLTILNFKLGYFIMIVPCILIFHEISVVDYLCHRRYMGYRNNNTLDNSVNIWWLCLPTFGLSLHNNHHAKPGNVSFSARWFEVDIGGYIAKLLSYSHREG